MLTIAEVAYAYVESYVVLLFMISQIFIQLVAGVAAFIVAYPFTVMLVVTRLFYRHRFCKGKLWWDDLMATATAFPGMFMFGLVIYGEVKQLTLKVHC